MNPIKIIIQSEVFIIIALTALIIIALYYVKKKLDAADPLAKPQGVVLLATMLVEMIDKMVGENANKKMVRKLAPYIGTIAVYIFLSNILGLFGFESPTSNYSVTLTLTIISWILIQATAISSSGVKGYLHGFIEPYPVFLVMNFFGKVAPLISMSLRLFGNILSGSIIMTLVYTFTSFLSNQIVSLVAPVSGFLNFLGPLLAPVLHAYFDVFSGFIQMFIFITLTTVFIGNEIPQEE